MGDAKASHLLGLCPSSRRLPSAMSAKAPSGIYISLTSPCLVRTPLHSAYSALQIPELRTPRYQRWKHLTTRGLPLWSIRPEWRTTQHTDSTRIMLERKPSQVCVHWHDHAIHIDVLYRVLSVLPFTESRPYTSFHRPCQGSVREEPCSVQRLLPHAEAVRVQRVSYFWSSRLWVPQFIIHVQARLEGYHNPTGALVF